MTLYGLVTRNTRYAFWNEALDRAVRIPVLVSPL